MRIQTNIIREYLQARAGRQPGSGVGCSTLAAGELMPHHRRRWSRVERRLMALVDRSVNPQWGECYSAAQRAALTAAALDLGAHHLVYCEGYVSFPSIPVPFAHAWCLLNGQVWDPIPLFADRRAEYFGREVPLDVLRRTVARRGAWGPILLSSLPAAAGR